MKKNKQEETFTQVPHSLMKNKDLTDQDKLTLSVIISFINNGKECYIGNDTLGEMLGISKNAASSRVLRLQEIGCVSLRYTYKEGKKEIDKRYITLLSTTPQVSSTKQRVSSTKQQGIVPQTKGYSPTDDEVSSKLGGIIQPDNTKVLDKELNKLQHKVLDNVKPPVELTDIDKKELLVLVKESKAPENVIGYVEVLITDGAGFLTPGNKQDIIKNKNYFNRGTLLPTYIEQELIN
jgi:hypothetical protein